MVKTPIADFLDRYAMSSSSRFHMPGHKGKGGKSFKFDITEIDGAGDLFSDSGLIRESEKVASELFGFPTYYSTEGSSLAIRTMTSLASRGGTRRVIAARNAHRAFLSSAILLDLDVEWLCPEGTTYLSCIPTADDVRKAIERCDVKPDFVYITSPDYLGNTADVENIAAVCRSSSVPLLVDNAHGAYLKFLTPSRHPIDLGASMCADSAHKTLPVLTGGAYLHLSAEAEKKYAGSVKETMSLFATSSPSYLILRSLDLANRYLENCGETISAFAEKVFAVKSALTSYGFTLAGDEPLKITVSAKPYGYTGDALSLALQETGVIPEFHDPDFVTFMLTPSNTAADLEKLCSSLKCVVKAPPVLTPPPRFTLPRRAMTPRAAYFAESETVGVSDSVGRILSSAALSCPPAIPIAVCGEVIESATAEALAYYGTNKIKVVK